MAVKKRIKKIVGKKRIFPLLGEFSPKREEQKTYFQKIAMFMKNFKPSDYKTKDAEKRRKMAYEDAKQHADFYKNLVKKGIYPKGTKVRTKRKRHSNAYIVEVWMPEIALYGKLSKSKKEKVRNEIQNIRKKIKELAKEHGYPDLGLHSDLRRFINYGMDNEGEVRYIDTEVLWDLLPFKGRKPWPWEFKKKNLESKVLTFITFGSLILALIFLSPNITGNVIANLKLSSTNSLGTALLIIFFIFGLLKIKFYKTLKSTLIL